MSSSINYRSLRSGKSLTLPKMVRISYGLVMALIACQSLAWLVGVA